MLAFVDSIDYQVSHYSRTDILLLKCLAKGRSKGPENLTGLTFQTITRTRNAIKLSRVS